MKIIDKIIIEMKRQNLSQKDLAANMKGNTRTRIKDLSNILSGKRDPGAQLLEEIADGLECKWNLTASEEELKKFMIFELPQNPGFYHVRGYTDGVPDNMALMMHRDLDYIREQLRKRGFMYIGPGQKKDRVVVEIWVGPNVFLGTIV